MLTKNSETMNINDIKTGDSFLVKTDNFLGKCICAVMRRWAKKKGYPSELVFNHAATFVWERGKLYLYGSVDNGFNPILFTRHYDFDKSNFVVMRRVNPLTIEEEDQAVHYLIHLDTISKSYQYWNFIQWLLLVYLNINLFRDDPNGFLYCYESTMKLRKHLDPLKYKDVYCTDIFQLLYDKNWEIIYRNLNQ